MNNTNVNVFDVDMGRVSKLVRQVNTEILSLIDTKKNEYDSALIIVSKDSPEAVLSLKNNQTKKCNIYHIFASCDDIWASDIKHKGTIEGTWLAWGLRWTDLRILADFAEALIEKDVMGKLKDEADRVFNNEIIMLNNLETLDKTELEKQLSELRNIDMYWMQDWFTKDVMESIMLYALDWFTSHGKCSLITSGFDELSFIEAECHKANRASIKFRYGCNEGTYNVPLNKCLGEHWSCCSNSVIILDRPQIQELRGLSYFN